MAGSRRGVCYTRHAMTPRYPLASVDHALRIIEMLRAQPAMRLSDVARELGVANSTAHRLLSTLAHRGFIVQQQGTRRYLPGPALLDIGRSALLLSQLVARARPLVEALRDQLGETIHLAVREAASVCYVDAAESPRAVRVAARTGRRLPAHWTSTGKVLLAELDDETVRRLYGDVDLTAGTPNSITSLDTLLAELAACRERGYAWNLGESEEDVVAVAIPLREPAGTVIASIGCAAPSHRLAASDVEPVAAAMNEIVARIPLLDAG